MVHRQDGSECGGKWFEWWRSEGARGDGIGFLNTLGETAVWDEEQILSQHEIPNTHQESGATRD
ncbi:hypothetical protein ZHAS_00006936 [Anopheles sinensis]|uniref:Uncharacterized protein n=1 Tax=Anopheles sinensis TaxID=74873 RepID=A0A084VNA1_ANOSI|nr:hypothetical protein ZHAS_00006936 [Anopheles sinensis]